MKAPTKIGPDDYILSVFSREDRLKTALKIAMESFKKTSLTMKDIEKAVKKIRIKARAGE